MERYRAGIKEYIQDSLMAYAGVHFGKVRLYDGPMFLIHSLTEDSLRLHPLFKSLLKKLGKRSDVIVRMAINHDLISPIRVGELRGPQGVCGAVVASPTATIPRLVLRQNGAVSSLKRAISLAGCLTRTNTIIGLGAMSASSLSLGKAVGTNDMVRPTTGHNSTVGWSALLILEGLSQSRMEPSESTVVVLGAGGNIGLSVSKLLLNSGVKRVIAVDSSSAKTERMVELQTYGQVEVVIAQDAKEIPRGDALFAAVSEPKPLFSSGDINQLSGYKVIVDDSFPQILTESAYKGYTSLGGRYTMVVATHKDWYSTFELPGRISGYDKVNDNYRHNHPLCQAEAIAAFLGYIEPLTGLADETNALRAVKALLRAGFQPVFHGVDGGSRPVWRDVSRWIPNGVRFEDLKVPSYLVPSLMSMELG